jgi:diguanylate cyclase (GGDEF)-like protein
MGGLWPTAGRDPRRRRFRRRFARLSVSNRPGGADEISVSASFNHDRDVARLERRVNELELRLSQLAILHRAAQAASSAVAVEQVYTDLARELGSALPRVDEIAIMEWDRRRGLVRDVLDYRPRSGRRVAVTAGSQYALRDLPDLGALLRRGSGHLVSMVSDPATPPAQRRYMGQWPWKTLLQIPLVSGGRTLGAVELVDNRREAPFAQHEIELCETLAAQSALALQGALLFERIKHMADHDALTGLANPRTFRRRVAASMTGATRRRAGLALLVLDIDNFKHLNDTHGHAHGDRVLRRGASILRRHARVGDTAGRLGGDELALLLTGADHGQARLVAERLVAAFARDKVGVSVGVSVHPSTARSAADLIEHADSALLRAKALGKARVELAA